MNLYVRLSFEAGTLLFKLLGKNFSENNNFINNSYDQRPALLDDVKLFSDWN